ncbi:MAG TPA: hypothetical protein VGL06_06930 [Pseudonocardiaceae bacterium]
MGEGDPHIHVDVSAIHADAATRNMLASAFGLVSNLASVVTTGCGQQVPYAMTSPRPERVTCLACREHAHRQHLHYAELVEHHSRTPGAIISGDQARLAAERHRDLAKRFADLDL